jgi:hypothetical protein
LKRASILRSIQDEFPVVRNMKIVKSAPYSAAVWIDFNEPDIVIKL